MWSRKKRKKEGKGSSGSAGKNKQQQPQQQQPSRPTSMSPAPVIRRPPPDHLDSIETNKQLEDSDSLTDRNLSVPLPSSPLTANILDSLNGGAGSVVDGVSIPMNSTTEQLKQVIEEAKRTIRSQMSQIASSVVGTRQTPPLPVLSAISGRPTQTFDYGNQTNKELEQVAAMQREDLFRERERWRGNS